MALLFWPWKKMKCCVQKTVVRVEPPASNTIVPTGVSICSHDPNSLFHLVFGCFRIDWNAPFTKFSNRRTKRNIFCQSSSLTLQSTVSGYHEKRKTSSAMIIRKCRALFQTGTVEAIVKWRVRIWTQDWKLPVSALFQLKTINGSARMPRFGSGSRLLNRNPVQKE